MSYYCIIFAIWWQLSDISEGVPAQDAEVCHRGWSIQKVQSPYFISADTVDCEESPCPFHAHHVHELEGEKLQVAVAVVPIAHELNCAGVYCWMLLMSVIVVLSLHNCGMYTSEKSFHSVGLFSYTECPSLSDACSGSLFITELFVMEWLRLLLRSDWYWPMTAHSAVLIPVWSHAEESLCITDCCKHCWFCMFHLYKCTKIIPSPFPTYWSDQVLLSTNPVCCGSVGGWVHQNTTVVGLYFIG